MFVLWWACSLSGHVGINDTLWSSPIYEPLWSIDNWGQTWPRSCDLHRITKDDSKAKSGRMPFCLAHRLRMAYTFLNDWKKSKEYVITYENYIKCILQFQKIKFHWKESCLFIYIFSVAAFALQGQSWVAATETLWTSKPSGFTVWPFTEKACQSLP